MLCLYASLGVEIYMKHFPDFSEFSSCMNATSELGGVFVRLSISPSSVLCSACCYVSRCYFLRCLELSFPTLIFSVILSGVQSAGWFDIHFTVGTFCERAAPLAEKNAATRYHVLRSLINVHNEHRVFVTLFKVLKSVNSCLN
jgi:hypothetical protein